MTKKILPLIVLFLIGVSILIVYGYLQATSAPNDEGQKQPEIEISPETFDFGEVEFGQVVTQSFKVKNSGYAILEIKRVATSCACTTAKIAEEKLEPGETTELLVSYDTAAMGRSSHGMGEQERIIYVKSNDPLNPQITVTIYANVK